MNVENQAAVPYGPFACACRGLGFSEPEIEKLFACFDLDQLGTISFDEIEFLDAWNDAETQSAAREKARPKGKASWLNRDPYFHMEEHEALKEERSIRRQTFKDLGGASAALKKAVQPGPQFSAIKPPAGMPMAGPNDPGALVRRPVRKTLPVNCPTLVLYNPDALASVQQMIESRQMAKRSSLDKAAAHGHGVHQLGRQTLRRAKPGFVV